MLKKSIFKTILQAGTVFCGILLSGAEIPGIPRDSNTGNTGGYMTWNGGSRLAKYTELAPAFVPNFDEDGNPVDTSSSSSKNE